MKKNVLLFLLLPVFMTLHCQSGGLFEDKVRKGNFQVTITETGELRSVNAQTVTMPAFDFAYGRPKIVDLVKEGEQVKVGDYIGLIDTSGVARERLNKNADLDMALADLNRMQVEQATTMKKLQADLQSAETALRQAVIDTQRTRFEPLTQQNIARLRYKISKIDYEKALAKIEHQKLLIKEDLLIQEEKIKQIRAAIKKAERTIQEFILRAPADGLVVYYQERRSGKIMIGDERYPGDGIIRLPDLSRMKVLTTVNERDIKKISIGQKVNVRLDAYPKHVFKGEITHISQVCHPKERGSKIKVFDVDILLSESSRLLRPGMTVSCDFFVSELDDVLYVKNSRVYEQDGDYYIYLKRGSAPQKVAVTLGPRNADYVVVYGNIKAGEALADVSTTGDE